MVKIRLKRLGAKKKPFYRIVVADARRSRDGRFIEEIGYFDPLQEPEVIKIDAEKAKKWLGDGAQPTDRVRSLFRKAGIVEELGKQRRTMTKLVEIIAKSLVDDPDAVQVTETQSGATTVIQLKVADDDMGKVIGKQGRIAKALRTVVKSAASKTGKKVVVEIV